MTCASWEHEVFISFRGDDTRTGFTSHLYTALTDKGIRTFKDDKKLETGNTVAIELPTAIEKSRFAVVVLSSNFATSKWCLEEIAKVVHCRKQGKLILIPVFYHVAPSDVRHQTDCFQQAFANHEIDAEVIPEKVESWRQAFKTVGGIVGEHVTKQRDESEVVRKIVRRIFKEIQDTLPRDVSNGFVGMESRVDDVKRILSMECDEVRFIGICGMSGVGKTALARIVYDNIEDGFDKRSFNENIKDVSMNNDSNSLCKLQQKVLHDIFKDTIYVRSVEHGQDLLANMLRGLKVIIVLDDVNHVDQLTSLAGSRDWFGPGTRIIITTTDKDLLVRHSINEIYTCEELRGDEALRLFCQSAFKNGYPKHGYEELSDDIVELAAGLPLALKVYGSRLYGKEEDYWKDMLKKFHQCPNKEIIGRLKVVYARLDRDQQNTFKYIACFLKGRSIDLVKDILTNIGLYPDCEIPDLINKFLITINPDDSVWVHDLLQQMCWEVQREESERHNGKPNAIKCCKDVKYILSSKPKGIRTIEIINQEPHEVDGEDIFDDYNCFSKMRMLKLLRIINIHFPNGLNYLSNELRILEWCECSISSFPPSFEPNHIYALEMQKSKLETLWEKVLVLPNLRFINLSFSKVLIKIPDLTSTPNLEEVNLEGCIKLEELHASILGHKRLRYMNLKWCSSLVSLGRGTMEMEALETLLLSGCSNLKDIPDCGQNMKRLEHLYVDGTSIKKLQDNLGKMCNLRKLDISRTCIEELPSSIHHLKRLRFLCAQGCPLSSKIGLFLYPDLDRLSSGLRELDLSNCNLSMVPVEIGLLYGLHILDLSGNDIVSLPPSIGFLSKLRILYLNNCKRLQSLPRLSLVNEDDDYGRRDRFNYYILGEGLDVTKYRATHNNNRTVSCLNCPKLADNENGSYLVEKILHNYLQLRTNYWAMPEAVFKIAGAGSIIPPRFKVLKPMENLIVEGPWIGVAVCVVIVANHLDGCMDAKYVVTTHIHVGESHWKIPICINSLAKLDNQLVIYWTLDDDLQRIVYARKSNFNFSFTVEPGDGNLKVSRFGVCIIRDEDIQQLKQLEPSTNEAVNNMFRATLYLPTDLQAYMDACKVDKELHFFQSKPDLGLSTKSSIPGKRKSRANTNDLPSFHSNLIDLTSKMISFILDHEKHQYSLDSIHRTIKFLIEINQEVLSEWNKESMHGQLFPLVYHYYRISHGTSELNDYFVRLLKDISGSWLSVKLVLGQVVKRGLDDYTRKEMLQLLNDLDAVKSVPFSDNFFISFAYICKQTVDFSSYLNEEIQRNKNLNSLKAMAKVSSLKIAVVISMVVGYFGDSELLQAMKRITLHSSWLHVMESFSSKIDKWLRVIEQDINPRCDRNLCISECCYSADLLQELRKKISSGVINEDEVVMKTIKKLEMKIDEFCTTVEDMSSYAHEYSLNIKEMGKTLESFVADGNFKATKSCVSVKCNKDVQQPKKYEDSVWDMIGILYRANLSLPTDLPWYICDCGANAGLHSCHPIIHDQTNSTLKFFVDYGRQHDFLDGIRKIFECLHEINQKAFISTRRIHKYYYIHLRSFILYGDFLSFLQDVCDSWLSVKVILEKKVVNYSGEDGFSYEEMVWKVNDLGDAEILRISSHPFLNSIASVCEETFDLLCDFNEGIQGDEKSVEELEEVSRVTIAGMFSLLAAYVGDFKLLQELKDIPSNPQLLDLIAWFSRKGGEGFNVQGQVMKRSYGGELKVWDFHGNAILYELKNKMGRCGCFTPEIGKKISNFSDTIKDMRNHALKYIHDMKITRMNSNPFRHCFVDYKYLQERHTLFVCEAMWILYEAMVSIRSRRLMLQDHTNSRTLFLRVDLLDSIRKIFDCLHEINQEAHSILQQEPRSKELDILVEDHRLVSHTTFKLYVCFLDLLSESWKILMLVRWIRRFRFKDMTQLLNYVNPTAAVRTFYDDCIGLFASTSEETIQVFRRFNEELQVQSNERMESVKVLGEVSRVTFICVFGFLAACMGDFELMESLKDASSNSKLSDLMERFDKKKMHEVGDNLLWDLVVPQSMLTMGYIDIVRIVEGLKYLSTIEELLKDANRYMISFPTK